MLPTPSNPVSFIKSQKGSKMLVINDYIFEFNKTVGATKYYRCNHSGCSVTLHTDLNEVVSKFNGEHCHPSEPEEIQIRKFKEALKTRAKLETTPIPQIYDEEAIRFDMSKLTIAALPSEREMN